MYIDLHSVSCGIVMILCVNFMVSWYCLLYSTLWCVSVVDRHVQLYILCRLWEQRCSAHFNSIVRTWMCTKHTIVHLGTFLHSREQRCSALFRHILETKTLLATHSSAAAAPHSLDIYSQPKLCSPLFRHILESKHCSPLTHYRLRTYQVKWCVKILYHRRYRNNMVLTFIGMFWFL